MSDFSISYNKTKRNEGGYVNDPNDTGGETWEGIARNFHSSWEGWQIIDLYKTDKSFPSILDNNEKLELSVKKFYKKEFWDVIKGDDILIQDAADAIYDSSVNMGPKRAIILAQKSLMVNETGIMDDVTLNRLNNKA